MTKGADKSTTKQVPDIEVWIIDPRGAGEEGEDFALPTPRPPGEVEEHAWFGKKRGESDPRKVDSQEFLDSWRQTFKTIQAVFEADEAKPRPDNAFALESVTAKLSISAKGKVAFIGELGGEVSFEACFSRRSS